MDFNELTIIQIREKLKNKEIDALSLAESVIKKIEEDDKREDKIYAYLEVFKEEALEQAKKAQERINKGEDLPLLGVPLAIKDNLCYKDHLMTASSKMLEGYKAPYTAPAVQRLIDNGALIIGRTNMDEFAMGGTTETSNYGVTRNPKNRNYVPGGSSGGSAAAVSAGFAFGALGSDTGGSIRQPASFCGIVGVKPTYGRVPRLGCIAMASSLDQVGPLTKDVKDAALMTKIISGFDPKESTTLNIPVPDYTAALDGNIKGMKIGLAKEYYDTDLIAHDVKESIIKAIDKLKAEGAEIVDITLPNAKYGSRVYTAVMDVEVASNMGRYDGIRYGYHPKGDFNLDEYYYTSRSVGLAFETRARILFGTLITGKKFFYSHYQHALKVRRLMQMDFENAFKNVDVIISPTSPVTAGLLGTRDKTDSALSFLADSYISNINLVGLPAMSVPAGADKNNLPIGIQFIAKQFNETDMFRMAYAHELASK
ncbi:Asp-tRNA(Asn)/Glu-tRNA(Gln) amidotransferase subunit GatA [uncultured Brachyspira sp.]|uniref:Asp-tRNA(Asn)/Glu-tRNA(Gln) amidotransferase subunit GatA n=1 Tax=uncultured Brachyspira sp. TaxID=221953 RepID=UPI0025CBEDEE|nr:Asp-tRNA(Asn)/Glu-tRNA(Gln) amidotransferase subunit GatA [uncultured Brachyspira sp.]